MYGNRKPTNSTDYVVTLLLLTFTAAIFILQTPPVYADTAGINYANSVLATPWKGETAAIGPGNNICATSKGDETGYWQNFGFKIPDGAKISGIKVLVDSSQANSNSQILVSVGKNSKSLGATEFAIRPVVGSCTSSEIQKLGTPTELWGQSWTVEEINSKTFGVQVKSDLGNSVLQLDSIGVVIDYTTDSPKEELAKISAPSLNLLANPLSQTIINLSWSPESQNNDIITGYIIERKLPSDADYIIIDSVSPRFLTYSDAGLLGNTEYSYRVSSVHKSGAITNSNEVTVTTPAFLLAPNQKNKIYFPLNTGKLPNIPTANISDQIVARVLNESLIEFWVEEESSLKIKIPSDFNATRLQHVGIQLYFDWLKTETSDTYFVYDINQGLTVTDPYGIFSDVKINMNTGEKTLEIWFTPRKLIDKTDLLVNMVNEKKVNSVLMINNAFKTVEMPYYKNPNLKNHVLDSDGNMIPYDSFGNLDNKFLRTVKEPFVYHSNIGKSYRIDDGFGEKVSAERIKAQKIVDNMLKPSLSLEPEKKDMTKIKAFKYPKNVGHNDRRDVQTIKTMMEKENVKAQGQK